MKAENPQTPKKKAVKKAAKAKDIIVKPESETTPKVVKKAATKSTSVKDIVTISFQVTYATRFGQNIFLSGNHPVLGNGNEENALKLAYTNHEHWGTEVKLNKADIPKSGLKYFYLVENEDGSVDKSAPYHLHIDELTKQVYISDAWNYPGFIQNIFSTKVFKVLSDKIASSDIKASTKKGSHKFKISAPEMPAHNAIFLLGSGKDFGDWDTANITILSPDKETGSWTTYIDATDSNVFVEYKYGVYDLDKKLLIAFEDGPNRTLVLGDKKAIQHIINDGFLHTN
ncbi:MAG TPA: carbohydrate-binding module family 20 domain-containing protein [Arachidicoccus sp.]